MRANWIVTCEDDGCYTELGFLREDPARSFARKHRELKDHDVKVRRAMDAPDEIWNEDRDHVAY